jgi:hypothetical protein
MTKIKMDRRELMRLTMLGGLGAALVKYDPNVLLNPEHYTSLDGFQNLVSALNGGPAAERLFAAYAQQPASDIVFVHVKFYMGMNGNYFMKIGNNSILNKAGAASGTLNNLGFNALSTLPKHSAAKLNRYVSNMIYHGTIDGNPRGSGNVFPNTASEIAASTAEADALLSDYQVFGGTGLAGIGQHNQQTFNINFSGTPTAMGQGCLNYMLANTGILNSPLGIVALGSRNNIIANAGGTAMSGRIMQEFIDGMGVLTADGYVKKSAADSLAVTFDAMARKAENAKSIRDNIRSGIADLKKKAAGFSEVLPYRGQAWISTGRNTPIDGRTAETLGYFALTGRVAATGLFNNFAIGINTIDLNGNDMDNGEAGVLNAVDAIQQTAIGVHMLIKRLKSEGKSYVIEIESELSRSLGMGDSGVLSAVTIVGGPKFRSAYRSNFLAPMILADTNAQSADFAAGSMVNADGRVTGVGQVIKDNYRLGVAHIIAEATGKTEEVLKIAQPLLVFTKT